MAPLIGRRVIVDGTGTKQERQIRRMQAARDAGFFVKVIYVRVPPSPATPSGHDGRREDR